MEEAQRRHDWAERRAKRQPRDEGAEWDQMFAVNGSCPKLVRAQAQRLHLVFWQQMPLPFFSLQKRFLCLGSLIVLLNFYVSLRQRFNFWVLFMCTTITFILEMCFVACIPLLSSVHKTSQLLRPSKRRRSFPSEVVGVAWFSRAWESHEKSVPCDLWSNLSYAALYRRETRASRSWSGTPAMPPSPLPCFLFACLLSSLAVHTHSPHHTSQKRKTWWYSHYCPVCCPLQCTLIHLGEKKPFL